MNRRSFLHRAGLVTAGIVLADELDLVRRFFPSAEFAEQWKIRAVLGMQLGNVLPAPAFERVYHVWDPPMKLLPVLPEQVNIALNLTRVSPSVLGDPLAGEWRSETHVPDGVLHTWDLALYNGPAKQRAITKGMARPRMLLDGQKLGFEFGNPVAHSNGHLVSVPFGGRQFE